MIIRRLFLVVAGALAVTAAGCGAGGGSSSLPRTVASVTHARGPAAHQRSKLGIIAEPMNPCPQQTVFVRLPGEIRGYPLAASGPTGPCTDVVGDQTLLNGNGNGYGAMAVSVHGNLHALAFQSNAAGGLMIFSPDAWGNPAPLRSINVGQDYVALAVDSQVNDYVVASENYEGDNCWSVVPITALAASMSNCDANVSAIYGLAVTPQDELVVLGSDATTTATRVDVFANAATATPTLVRSISGSATGLPATNTNYFNYSYSLATDPVVGTIYVLSADPTGLTLPKISEFGATAHDNVAPDLTLSGALTQLPISTFAMNVLTVDSSSNLYVNSTGVISPNIPLSTVAISVYAPGATGNVKPLRVILDDTLVNPGSGGIAVRN